MCYSLLKEGKFALQEHNLFTDLNARAFTPTSGESDRPGTHGNLAAQSIGDRLSYALIRDKHRDPGAGEVAFWHTRSNSFLQEMEDRLDWALAKRVKIRQLSRAEIDAWVSAGRPRLRQETPERIAQLDAQMKTFRGVPKGAAELYGPRIRN